VWHSKTASGYLPVWLDISFIVDYCTGMAGSRGLRATHHGLQAAMRIPMHLMCLVSLRQDTVLS
jgi:hypothetical protein